MGEREPQDPCDGAWRADAVRYQVLIRALPVQRHDVLGPLAVVRMGLALLQRRLDAGTSDDQRLRAKLAETDQQVAEAVRAVAALRWWDDVHAERRDLLLCAQQSMALVSLALGMRGHRLQPAVRSPDLADDDAPPLVAAPAVYYALLALLLHAHDTLASPHEIGWQVGLDGLVLRAMPLPAEVPVGVPMGGSADSPDPALSDPAAAAQAEALRLATPSSTLRRVDAQALRWLMDDMGWHCSRQAQGWTLGWRA